MSLKGFDLELSDPPASSSRVLGLQFCTTVSATGGP